MKQHISNTQKSLWTLLAAWLFVGSLTTACSNEDQMSSDDKPIIEYTMTVEANRTSTIRALTISGKDIAATWATTDNVYVKKGSDWATGSLKPNADGQTAYLSGTLSGVTIKASDELTLQFPKSGAPSYTGQKGTLTNIADNYDYASADIIVSSVEDGKISTASPATFINHQAIVKFTLIDKADGTTTLNATNLTIKIGDEDEASVSATAIPDATYTENGDGVVYLAVPTIDDKDITLTATVGDNTYNYFKKGVSFTSGNYYPITVKMTRDVKVSDIGSLIASNGCIYSLSSTLPAGVTAVGMVAYVGNGSNCTHGLAIALEDLTDPTDSYTYSNAVTACSEYMSATPVPGGTWRLPTKDDWLNMFNACAVTGDTTSDIGNIENQGFRDKLYATGASHDMTNDNKYWTGTSIDEDYAYYVNFSSSKTSAIQFTYRTNEFNARACLAF